MIIKNVIEPFPTYPESEITSKEKSLEVIQRNYYYFIVVGLFLVAMGCITLIGWEQDREILILGISNIFIGIVYIGLSWVAKKFKSRFAAIILGGVIVFMIIGDFILFGRNAIDYLFVFEVILAGAAYRILKAVTYYNKMK